ncbi:efflux RND transporter periplasmic adaptor subunit [Fusobacterium sp.]|uniref:efflux RND transporter periplasmic adaptor subunit n=1 Tax=Fusobacterium sp. TaxID=68766 RepID=UPI0025C2F65E|nr:efflux RND transporter periplasmic adaptor subunit [Fusobacterium sp.]
MKLRYVALIFGVLLSGCKKETKEIIRPVETAIVAKVPENLYYEYPAIVEADNQSILSFKVAGSIKKMEVEVGSYVKKDDVIAKMDTRDYEVQLKAFENKSKIAKNMYDSAKAIADNAKKQYQRVEVLYKEKTIPKKSYDEALAAMRATSGAEMAAYSQYQESLQGIENSKNQLQDTVLKAPYTGYISKKFAGEGNVVSGGIPVVAMASSGDKKVRINISGRDFEKIENGKGEFIFENKHYPLEVADIGKVKNIGKMTYPVTYTFTGDSSQLLVDAMGIVRIAYDVTAQSKEVIIPAEAIFEKDGKSRVWLYKDGEVKSTEVTMLSPYNNGTMLVKGVTVGDKIVIRGVHELTEGQKVNEVDAFTKTNVGNVL